MGGSRGQAHSSASHFDGADLNHHVIDRYRPIVDADVPDGDVVIATWWETAEWVNALSQSKGAKVYFIQHHEVFSYLPIDRCEATYRMPLHKIVIAHWLKEIMSERYDDTAVDLVPNAVDRSQFFPLQRTKQAVPTVGLLYSTTPFKGLDAALAALKIVKKSHQNLCIISFGSELPSRKIALPPGSEFKLCPPQDRIGEIYRCCDVWLAASRTEGFNLPAIEAMACGTPVVSTRTGWPAEAIDTYVNGVLTEVDDIWALARGVQWVLSQDDAGWRRLSDNALETVSSCSWEMSAKLFEIALKRARDRARAGEIAGGC